MIKTHRRGDPKPLESVMDETPGQLLGNIRKGFHIDGGGQEDYYIKKAREIMDIIASNKDDFVREMLVAKFLHKEDDSRLLALRQSIGRRVVLLVELLKQFKNPIRNYVRWSMFTYERKIEKYLNNTENHSKKLDPLPDVD